MSEEQEKWYTITGGGPSLKVSIADGIGGGKDGASGFLAELRKSDPSIPADVFINSNGGNIFAGMAIFNALLARQGRVVAKIESIAASMGSVVAMAADEIEISANGWIVIHNPYTAAGGESEDLRKTADLLDRLKPQLLDAYMRHVKVSREEVSAMMDAETWLDADQAVEMGFATRKTEAIQAAACLENPGFSKMPDAARSLFGNVEPPPVAAPAEPEPDPAPVEPEPEPPKEQEPPAPDPEKEQLAAENARLADELAKAKADLAAAEADRGELSTRLIASNNQASDLQDRLGKLTGGFAAPEDQGGARLAVIDGWKNLVARVGYEEARKKHPEEFAAYMKAASARR